MRIHFDQMVQVNGCCLLHTLALIPEHRKRIVKEGGLDRVLDAMKNYPYNFEVQGYGLELIYNLLSFSDQMSALMIENVKNLVENAMEKYKSNNVIQDAGKNVLQLFKVNV